MIFSTSRILINKNKNKMSNINEINRIAANGSGLLDGGESIDLTSSDTHQIVAISILEDSTTFTAL